MRSVTAYDAAMPRARELRLFVAVHPPPELVTELFDALDTLTLPAHRRTPPEQVHITMQFIGNVPQRRLQETIETVREAIDDVSCTTLEVRDWMIVPRPASARLVAVETDAPAPIVTLKSRLAERLAHRPHKRERSFRPHLTLCRFNGSPRIEPPTAPLPTASFTVDSLRLMASTLHPDGARHKVVEVFDLKGPR